MRSDEHDFALSISAILLQTPTLNTALMIHSVYEQVTYASHILTMRPGDIITTGTPVGVGFARKPPVYLQPGDRSVCAYEGVGTLTNPVVGS